MNNESILLKRITSVLLGTHDFQKLAHEAVALMVRELKDQNLVGAAIFRVHEKENVLYAYAFATKHASKIHKLLPTWSSAACLCAAAGFFYLPILGKQTTVSLDKKGRVC